MDGEVEFLSVEVSTLVIGFALVSFWSGLAAYSESFGVTVENDESSSDTLETSKGTSGVMHFWEDLVSDVSAKKGTGRHEPVVTTVLKPELELMDATSTNLVSEFTAIVGLFPFSDTFFCISIAQLVLLSTAGSGSLLIDSVSFSVSFTSVLDFESDLDSEGFVLLRDLLLERRGERDLDFDTDLLFFLEDTIDLDLVRLERDLDLECLPLRTERDLDRLLRLFDRDLLLSLC